jgi:hypothetical protein
MGYLNFVQDSVCALRFKKIVNILWNFFNFTKLKSGNSEKSKILRSEGVQDDIIIIIIHFIY